MIHLYRYGLVLIFCNVLSTNARNDYFKYIGPNLTFAQNRSFTQFYLLGDTKVFHSVTEINLNDRYFPKCCPPEYRYDPSDRKCARSNETAVFEMLALDVNLIKSGLKDCEVIVDHNVSLSEVESFIGDNGIVKYKNETFPLGKYCVDGVVDEEVDGILRLCYESSYCTRKGGLTCLKKCCPDGEMYLERACGPQPEHGFPIEPHRNIISNVTDQFAVFTQRRTCKLHSPKIPDENVSVSENGSLNLRLKGVWTSYPVDEEKYCFELGLDDPVKQYLLMCNDISDRNSIKFRSSKIAMILSCCCLAVTMAVYVFVHKLEKTIHRIVFCYCLVQLIGFATLTHLQFEPYQTDRCVSLALLVIFAFLAGFAWLNVMCYDMWRTLGTMEAKVGYRKRASLRKTLYYSLYAWSVPAAITVLCYYEHKYYLFPWYLHAHIGERFCILEQKVKDGNYGHTLFFILPMGLVMIANTAFFVLTVRYIIQATDNVRRMSDSKKKTGTRMLFALKKKAFMALKLFLIMGISWTFEVVSSIVDFNVYEVTSIIEICWDTFNCCQGVFVFLIFVLRWKVIQSLMVKLKVIVVSSVSRSTSLASSSSN